MHLHQLLNFLALLVDSASILHCYFGFNFLIWKQSNTPSERVTCCPSWPLTSFLVDSSSLIGWFLSFQDWFGCQSYFKNVLRLKSKSDFVEIFNGYFNKYIYIYGWVFNWECACIDRKYIYIYTYIWMSFQWLLLHE